MTASEKPMNVEVDRIPALHLCLADLVFDDHAGLQRWVPIVGLTLDTDHVLVMCQGDEQALRIPAGALVAVRRPELVGPHGDDSDLNDRMSGWYPGDVDSASAAVAAHSQQSPQPPAGSLPYPNSHYEGLYGGDLDHVVDAVGGTPDAETRGRRDAATRRHLTQSTPQAEPAQDDSAEDDDGELLGRMGDGYIGDVRHIFDKKGS